MKMREYLAQIKEIEARNTQRIADYNQRAFALRDENGDYVCRCGAVLAMNGEQDGDLPRHCPECGAMVDYSKLLNGGMKDGRD